MIYAYVRVSTKEQNVERQLKCFYDLNIDDKNIYIDKESGKDFNRCNYKKLINKLKKDDLLIIKSIDRLGRNYEMIIEEWKNITKNIGANIHVVDMPLLNTNNNKDLTGKLISDIVLELLCYFAENERTNIKIRQMEGIKLAKEKGIKFGRPNTSYSIEFIKIINDYKNGLLTIKDALMLSNMKKSNFYYHMNKIIR